MNSNSFPKYLHYCHKMQVLKSFKSWVLLWKSNNCQDRSLCVVVIYISSAYIQHEENNFMVWWLTNFEIGFYHKCADIICYDL